MLGANGLDSWVNDTTRLLQYVATRLPAIPSDELESHWTEPPKWLRRIPSPFWKSVTAFSSRDSGPLVASQKLLELNLPHTSVKGVGSRSDQPGQSPENTSAAGVVVKNDESSSTGRQSDTILDHRLLISGLSRLPLARLRANLARRGAADASDCCGHRQRMPFENAHWLFIRNNS